MKKGTQAMLDAAKDDATLLPFDTVFITKYKGGVDLSMPIGIQVARGAAYDKDLVGHSGSVAFQNIGATEYWYVSADNLLPSKKYKPKKWKNGTQAQLDAAKDDARLIPKKTYFISRYGATRGLVVSRIDSPNSGKMNVCMWEANGEFDFHNASNLEPIND